MKFLKSNLDLLIAALLVILAIGAYFWPLAPYKENLVKEAQERLAKVDAANSYKFTKSKPIVIPGVGSIPDKDEPGNPTVSYAPNLAAAKVEAQNQMKLQTDRIIQEASVKNREKRVKLVATKGPQGTIENFIPLLSDGTVPEDGLLPTPLHESWGFGTDFSKQYELWYSKLGYIPYPPSTKGGLQEDIDKRLKEETDTMVKNAQAAAPSGGGQPPASANVQLPIDKRTEIIKGVISKRAGEVRCYVDDNAFPKPDWAKEGAVRVQPTPTQMFDALVTSWLVNDAVNAIAKTNENSHNVGSSPVKRLEQITVGNSAGMGGASNVLLALSSAPAGMVGGGAPMAAPAALNADTSHSMTGHVVDPNYDVALMNIRIVVDPAYLNAFIDELYRQNNGYTVLSIKTSLVDPLDAAANGYLYGQVQCVRVDIQVEDLLFRAWLDPIMPVDYRRVLGRPLPGAAGPGLLH